MLKPVSYREDPAQFKTFMSYYAFEVEDIRNGGVQTLFGIWIKYYSDRSVNT